MSFHSRLSAARAAFGDILNVAIEPDFDFGSREYRSLWERSHATAFQGARWLALLHSQVTPALSAERVTVTVRDKISGELVLILPLVRIGRNGLRVLEFVDFGLCDYLAAIYDPTNTARLVADASLPARVAELLPAADIIALTKLQGDDAVLERLFPTAHRAHMRVSSHAVRIDTAWSEWRQHKLDESLRRELDAKRRRFAKAGTPFFTRVEDETDIVRAFDALRRFRSHRFGERGVPDIIDSEAVFSFYRQIAIEGARTREARTFCLYLSGEPVAVMFGLAHRKAFSLLLVGFDLVRYRRFSVGLLAIEDTVRASFEAGDTAYDFTIGDYPFKDQFAAEPAPLYEWHVPQTLRGRLALFAIEGSREAKRILKPFVLHARAWRLKTEKNRQNKSPAN
jgi:CelD/BcsL family acetyltransferase involved in cellulose biosynthesis